MGLFQNLFNSVIEEVTNNSVTNDASDSNMVSDIGVAKDLAGEDICNNDEDCRSEGANEAKNLWAVYPKWPYSEILSSNSDETDEYFIHYVYVRGTENDVNSYNDLLASNGFSGDWQIRRKHIASKEYVVDFSFAFDGDDVELHYLIKK